MICNFKNFYNFSSFYVNFGDKYFPSLYKNKRNFEINMMKFNSAEFSALIEKQLAISLLNQNKKCI